MKWQCILDSAYSKIVQMIAVMNIITNLALH